MLLLNKVRNREVESDCVSETTKYNSLCNICCLCIIQLNGIEVLVTVRGIESRARAPPSTSSPPTSRPRQNLRFCFTLFSLSPSYFIILCTTFVYNGSVSRAVSFVCDNFSKAAWHRLNIPSNKGT
jgi:hypothetical protein